MARLSLRAAALAALLLCALAPPAQASILDTIGNAISDGFNTAVGAVGGAVGTAVNGASGVANTVADTVTSGVSTAIDAVKNAYQWTECKAVDLASFSIEPCWEAPPSDLCSDACKAELDKLPAPCLDRFVTSIYNSGDERYIDRIESQLAACNITFEVLVPAPAPAPAPLPQ